MSQAIVPSINQPILRSLPQSCVITFPVPVLLPVLLPCKMPGLKRTVVPVSLYSTCVPARLHSLKQDNLWYKAREGFTVSNLVDEQQKIRLEIAKTWCIVLCPNFLNLERLTSQNGCYNPLPKQCTPFVLQSRHNISIQSSRMRKHSCLSARPPTPNCW